MEMAKFKLAMMFIGLLWAASLVSSQEDLETLGLETGSQPHDLDLPDPLGTEASVPLATAAILPESNATPDDSEQGQQEPALPGEVTPVGSSGPREATASGTTSSPQFLRLRRQAHPVPPATASILPESNVTSDDSVQGQQGDSLTGEATHVGVSGPRETDVSGQTATTSTPPLSLSFLRVRRQAHPVPPATASILPESNVTSDDSVQGQQEDSLAREVTHVGVSEPREADVSGQIASTSTPLQSPSFLRVRRQAYPVSPPTTSSLPESNATSEESVQESGETTPNPRETIAAGPSGYTSAPPQLPPLLRVRRQAHPVSLTSTPSLPESNATSEESVQESGETTPNSREAITAGPSGSTSAPPQSPPLLRVRRQGHPGAAQGGPDGDRKVWSDMMHALYRRYFQSGPLTPQQTP